MKVITKCLNGDQYKWKSRFGDEYSIEIDRKGPFIDHGTKIIILLDDDQLLYLNEKEIRSLVDRYSLFNQFPILFYTCNNKKNKKKEKDEKINKNENEKEKTEKKRKKRKGRRRRGEEMGREDNNGSANLEER